ncbi:MAG: hypothetical protein COA67_12415 [Lutibacter sp.]|nr:MAG: hypothetical protein COA67_12415 [Lutibacter sp.]
MNLNFPIDIDTLAVSKEPIAKLLNPRLSNPHLQIDENDFYLNVYDVASYRVQNGNNVLIQPHENSDEASIRLFLNGSVLGAVLHQRGLIPFHGSTFLYEGKGVMICGQSGAGKSSTTAAFCQKEAAFINDDITPIKITKDAATIIPIRTRIKLWDDSLEKLDIENTKFDQIRPTLEKFYLPNDAAFQEEQELHHIIILGKHNEGEYKSNELEGMAKFNTLRKQIYRKMYLKGMPEREKTYFKQLFNLANKVRITKVIRPQKSSIYDTKEYIKTILAS